MSMQRYKAASTKHPERCGVLEVVLHALLRLLFLTATQICEGMLLVLLSKAFSPFFRSHQV